MHETGPVPAFAGCFEKTYGMQRESCGEDGCNPGKIPAAAFTAWRPVLFTCFVYKDKIFPKKNNEMFKKDEKRPLDKTIMSGSRD